MEGLRLRAVSSALSTPVAVLSVVLLMGGVAGAQDYGPHPAGTKLDPVRQKIVEAALGEVGKVSDHGGEPGLKKGWERLKQYFDEASDWGPDCFARGGGIEDGVKLVNRNPPGGEWCGIFAAWCARQAGVDARWKFGVGPAPLKARYDVQNIAPGDIGVIREFVHHFVVVKRDGDTLESVSGNSYFHEIRRDATPRKLSSIRYYYRTSDLVWVPDSGATAPDASGAGTEPSSTPPAAPPASPVDPATSAAPPPAGSPAPGDDAAAGLAGAVDGIKEAADPLAAGPVCRRGSRGDGVRAVQERLAALGYTVSVDGEFGPRTEQAVRAFQRDHGCHVDGVVGAETRAALAATLP